MAPAQALMNTEFAPPKGGRGKRLKQVMDFGRLRTPATIHGLVGSLSDEDINVRWLAGSHPIRFGGQETVETLAAYLDSNPPFPGRTEALRVLGLLAEADGDEDARKLAVSLL